MRPRLPTISLSCLIAALIASFTLAACGGDGSGRADSEDPGLIRIVITEALTSDDPSTCTELQTQRFTAQTTRRTGDEAVAQCERNVSNRADSVEVSKVDVSGRGATAEGALTGGLLNGQTIQVALVKDDQQWKLDELSRIVDIDSKALATSFRKLLASDERVPPDALDCIATQIEQAPDEELQQFLLIPEGSSRAELFRPCAQFFRPG